MSRKVTNPDSKTSPEVELSYGDESTPIELSVVMPCLNERLTLGTCIQKAQATMKRLGIAGEVVIADNGSTDGSQEIAMSLGARVVPVRRADMGARCAEGSLRPVGNTSLWATRTTATIFPRSNLS